MTHSQLLLFYTWLWQMQNIPDMRAYALGWKLLMAVSQRAGYRGFARMMRARWHEYRCEAPSEYVRLFDTPFSELILVEAK
jgi:hypothetical protein